MSVFFRCLFWFAVLVLGPLSWCNHHGWQVHRELPRALMVPRAGAAFQIRVPSGPFTDRMTDGGGHGESSDLRLFDGAQELGPGHAPLDQVANGGQGLYSDWDNILAFSALDNSDPRLGDHVYTTTFRVYPSYWAVLVLAALGVFAAWVAAESALIVQMRPWRRQGAWTMAHKRAAAVAAVAAVAVGVAGLTLYLLFEGISVHAPLPANAISLNEGYAYVAFLPQHDTAVFKSYSDESPEGPRSNLALFEDATELGPAHSPHTFIRSDGGGAYSHWGTDLYFSSSDGSDPRDNGRAYRAIYRAFLAPPIAISLLLLCGLVIVARWLPLATLRESLTRLPDNSRSQRELAESGPTGTRLRLPSLLRFGGLVALYTVVLLLLYTSLVARESDTGALKINFEYKVF